MRLLATGSMAILSVALVSGQAPGPKRQALSSPASPAPWVSTERAVLDQYCVTCHNEKLKTANLMLDTLDLARLGDNLAVAEKVVRKLRSGMMPPPGLPRPDPATRETLIVSLENELDRLAVTHLPSPGLHRLNRTEYGNAIRDLLALEVDATQFLPSDDSTHGFDNVAGALGMSPALMEAYLSAAGKISRLAIGSGTAPTQTVYEPPDGTNQNYHIEGLPFGTRGGLLIKQVFPADAGYVFRVVPIVGYGNAILGGIRGEHLEITVDGERVKLFDWDKELAQAEGRIDVTYHLETSRIPIKAGLHTVGVTFLATQYAPGNDLTNKFQRTTMVPGNLPGMTFFPHIGRVWIEGPYDGKRATDTPSRRKIFVCRPASEREEEACARNIVSTLAKSAYRRPATAADVGALMEFYLAGRAKGDFENGIEMAVRRLLADPEFIYRGEVEPVNLASGKSYRITDLEFASRLSFFLWSSIPDDELITLAAQRKLRDPAVLERQVRRMLADPRSEALVTNFTGQWLNVRGLQTHDPVVNFFPDFDDNLRRALRQEVELFFDSIVREDRSVFDLLTADYTFLNQRLAKHYGIPNVYGSQFRRVALGPEFDMRRGLLGKGALLTITSQPGRTSPVQRGKWFMQTILGVSPPDPPPNVPPIQPKKEDFTGNTKEPTMRQKMEQHRVNPVCASCHKIMDPIGFSLENFDAVGAWRSEDSGSPIDATSEIVDGTKLNGPASLREVAVRYSDQFERVVTEKLLIYALGRGVEYQDMPLVRAIVRDAAPANHRFSSIVLGIVKSTPFQMNMKGENSQQQRAAR